MGYSSPIMVVFFSKHQNLFYNVSKHQILLKRQSGHVCLIQDFVENLSQQDVSINKLTEKLTNILINAGLKSTPFRLWET